MPRALSNGWYPGRCGIGWRRHRSRCGVWVERSQMRTLLFQQIEVQLQIDRSLGRPNAADVMPHDCHAAVVSLFAQTLEALLSTVRIGIQQPRDARFKGIKQTGLRPAAPRRET